MANNHFKISKGVTLTPQSTEPGSPTNGDIYYDSTLNKFRKYENGAWTDFASGQGEGINYIENSDAEADTLGYATYDDGAVASPVDGTAGSPTAVTFDRTTTASEILREIASFKFSKSAVDGQGEGVSYDFSIDPKDKESKLAVAFDHKNLDSNYVNGDVRIFVYDVDNSTLIGNVSNDDDGDVNIAPTEGGTFFGEFTTTNSLNYRLIFHVTSTNAAAYALSIDRVRVGPVGFIPVTYQNSATIDLTGSGDFASGEIIVDRIGNQVTIYTTGTVTYNSSLDTATSAVGVIPDWARPTGNAINVFNYSASQVFRVVSLSDGSIQFQHRDWAGTLSARSNASGFTISYPVEDVSNVVSNNRLNQTSTKSQIYLGTSQNITTTALTLIELDTVEFDDFNLFNLTNNSLVIKKSGYYTCSYGIGATGITTGDQMIAHLRRNGVDIIRQVQRGTEIDEEFNATKTVFLNKGDELTLHIESETDTSYTIRGLQQDTYLEVIAQPDFTSYGVLNPNTELLEASSTHITYPITVDEWGDLTSLNLPPGTWDITCYGSFQSSGTTTTTHILLGISDTADNFAPGTEVVDFLRLKKRNANGDRDHINFHKFNVTLTSQTTYYLKSQAQTSISGLLVGYKISARRVK